MPTTPPINVHAGSFGTVYRGAADTWANIRAASAGTGLRTGANMDVTSKNEGGVPGQPEVGRGFGQFYIGNLPKSIKVSAIVLSFKFENFEGNDPWTLAFTESFQPDEQDLAAAHYNDIVLNSPDEFATRLAKTSGNGVKNINLNQIAKSRLEALRKAGSEYFKICMRLGAEIDNEAPSYSNIAKVNVDTYGWILTITYRPLVGFFNLL
jgi:hypothetical protein